MTMDQEIRAKSIELAIAYGVMVAEQQKAAGGRRVNSPDRQGDGVDTCIAIAKRFGAVIFGE